MCLHVLFSFFLWGPGETFYRKPQPELEMCLTLCYQSILSKNKLLTYEKDSAVKKGKIRTALKNQGARAFFFNDPSIGIFPTPL